MKKIFYRIVCLLCIIIIIVMPMIYEFYWDSKTQVKHFELVTNRRIPIYRNSGFYVDFNENFYVGIDDFKWIEVFDKDGKFICSIGMQGIVYNFYVDKDKLLHVFCTYRTAENIYEQVIDIDTNSIISELNKLKDEEYFKEHKLASVKHDISNLTALKEDDNLVDDKIVVGDYVYIKSYQTTGEVLKIKGDKYTVRVGKFEMSFKAELLLTFI